MQEIKRLSDELRGTNLDIDCDPPLAMDGSFMILT